MTSVTQGLQELHSILLAIQDFETELQRGPRRIVASDKKVATKTADIEAQKLVITDLRKSSDQKTLQLKTNEARIIDLKVKLNVAKSNREYEIITGQMEADAMANSVLEDEILEGLEKVDQANERLQELKKELEEAIAKRKTVEKSIADALPGIESELAAARESLKDAEAVVPAKHKGQYNRLINTHGAASLASVDDGCCTNCYGMLAPQEKVLLNTHQVIFCRACGRIMYNAAT